MFYPLHSALYARSTLVSNWWLKVKLSMSQGMIILFSIFDVCILIILDYSLNGQVRIKLTFVRRTLGCNSRRNSYLASLFLNSWCGPTTPSTLLWPCNFEYYRFWLGPLNLSIVLWTVRAIVINISLLYCHCQLIIAE